MYLPSKPIYTLSYIVLTEMKRRTRRGPQLLCLIVLDKLVTSCRSLKNGLEWIHTATPLSSELPSEEGGVKGAGGGGVEGLGFNYTPGRMCPKVKDSGPFGGTKSVKRVRKFHSKWVQNLQLQSICVTIGDKYCML